MRGEAKRGKSKKERSWGKEVVVGGIGRKSWREVGGRE